jgi:hypothetical protein
MDIGFVRQLRRSAGLLPFRAQALLLAGQREVCTIPNAVAHRELLAGRCYLHLSATSLLRSLLRLARGICQALPKSHRAGPVGRACWLRWPSILHLPSRVSCKPLSVAVGNSLVTGTKAATHPTTRLWLRRVKQHEWQVDVVRQKVQYDHPPPNRRHRRSCPPPPRQRHSPVCRRSRPRWGRTGWRC